MYRSKPIWGFFSSHLGSLQQATRTAQENEHRAAFTTLVHKSKKAPKARPVESSGGDIENALGLDLVTQEAVSRAPSPKANEKVTRPPNAWQSWMKQQYKELKGSTSGKLDTTKIIKELSTKWKALPDEEKRPYLDAAKANRQAKPPGKLTSYSLFIKENFDSVKARNPAIRPKEVLVNMANEWRAKSDEQKEEYRKRAEQHNQTLK